MVEFRCNALPVSMRYQRSLYQEPKGNFWERLTTKIENQTAYMPTKGKSGFDLLEAKIHNTMAKLNCIYLAPLRYRDLKQAERKDLGVFTLF